MFGAGHEMKVSAATLIFACISDARRAIPRLLQIPIFPLPNAVLFPRTILPLHVFEPRYRRLVNDVLGGDRRFAVFLMKPADGLPTGPEAEPFEIGCLGEIVRADALPDGRFDVLLAGLTRIRIEEFLTDVPYRVVGALRAEESGTAPEPAATDAFRMLASRYSREVLGREMGADLRGGSTEMLVNTAAASLEADVYERQRLLEAADLTERMRGTAERMAEQLEAREVIRAARSARPHDPRVN